MNVANCARCNKLFQASNGMLCPACLTETKSAVKQVVQYVHDHPGMLMEEVAYSCQIPVKDLEEMLFAGRLGYASEFIMIKCQSCPRRMSVKLSKGRFCPECGSKIEAQMSLSEREPTGQKEKEKPKPAKHPASRHEEEICEPIEASGPAGEDLHPLETPSESFPLTRPKAPPAKQESVSPGSDSYGFKRIRDV